MISVIMPIYNAQVHLQQSIPNILEQTYTDFELLLIDDGSTDDSMVICEKYASHDTRIRCIHTENHGVSHARNVGLKEAKGEYIRFVDADDELPVNSLEKMLVAMETTSDIDLVIGQYDDDGRKCYTGHLSGVYPREELVKQFLEYIPSFFYGVCWNKLYRMQIIRENALSYDENIHWCEDMIFNTQYYRYCRKVFYLEQTIYSYKVCKTSAMAKLSKTDFLYQYDMLKKRFLAAYKLEEIQSVKPEERKWSLAFLYTNLYQMFYNYSGQGAMQEDIKLYRHVQEDGFINAYAYHSEYRLIRYMQWELKHEQYFGLYVLYRTQRFLRRHENLKKILKGNKDVTPQFRL